VSVVEQLAPRFAHALVHRAVEGDAEPSSWTRGGVSGRLVELVGGKDSASLTLTASLLRDAQAEGETTAWVMRCRSGVFPPDLDRWGIDLEALVVVRVPDGLSVARASDRLARSGAFGVIVLDLGRDARVPTPLLSRLMGLARKHGTAVLFLTAPDAPSLGSLVSLRASTTLRREGDDRFVAELHAVKDKRRAPGWTHVEACCGPPGLR